MSLIFLIAAIIVFALAALIAFFGGGGLSIIGLACIGLVFFAASFLPLGNINVSR